MGASTSQLTARLEPEPDLDETARLANEAFGSGTPAFTAERLRWLYHRAFSDGAVVLALFAGSRKIGQVTLLGQALCVGGTRQPAVALIDLFIATEFRSREAIATLYGQVEGLCRERGIRFILAVPNGRAMGVNRRFLKLETIATLEIRAGLAAPLLSRRVATSARIETLDRSEALALLSRFEQTDGSGLQWTAAALWERLQDPAARYAVHATDALLLISSPSTRRHVPTTLLCGFLPRPRAPVGAADVRALVAAACRLHRRPLFVYVGINDRVPLPGRPVPARLRPSIMIVQGRDLASEGSNIPLDRFEVLDFDFA